MQYSSPSPSVAFVGLAAAELILAIQKVFPQVRLVPCEPIEGEDIHLSAYLPILLEERLSVQERIVEIEHSIQEKYGVQTVVVALAEREEGGSSKTPPQD
jgi:hypothetical protein